MICAMSQPNINKRRPSFPSADSSNVLRNIDKQNPLASPKIAWIKHGKYIALGGGGVAYFDIVDRIRWSLASENWVRWIARLGVGLHGLTVVSTMRIHQRVVPNSRSAQSAGNRETASRRNKRGHPHRCKY